MLLLVAKTAFACEYDACQSEGAVSAPSGWALSLPFEAGESVYVHSGYGPDAGSSLHCRAQDSSCTNDWYALDLNLPGHSDSGRGRPVLAAAPGTVVAAGWATEGWANYGQRVYIQHDPGDGHQYLTMYAHLESVAVSAGDSVGTAEAIGTLGRSCNGELECSSFSTPHVHFAVHRDSSFGGSGTGGSYGGRATIPEPVDGYSGLAQGQTLRSDNKPGGEDSGGDDTGSTSALCTVGLDAAQVFEEDAACVTVSGATFELVDGHGGAALLTQADTPSPDYAEGRIWSLEVLEAGDYEIAAWIPETERVLVERATYKVAAGAEQTKLYLDQAAARGDWASLGVLTLEAGQEDRWVRLGDNYDESDDVSRNVLFDALRIGPPGAEAADTGGSGGHDNSPDGDDLPGASQSIESGTCGCDSAGGASSASLLVVVFAYLVAHSGIPRRRHVALRRCTLVLGGPGPARTAVG